KLVQRIWRFKNTFLAVLQNFDSSSAALKDDRRVEPAEAVTPPLLASFDAFQEKAELFLFEGLVDSQRRHQAHRQLTNQRQARARLGSLPKIGERSQQHSSIFACEIGMLSIVKC